MEDTEGVLDSYEQLMQLIQKTLQGSKITIIQRVIITMKDDREVMIGLGLAFHSQNLNISVWVKLWNIWGLTQNAAHHCRTLNRVLSGMADTSDPSLGFPHMPHSPQLSWSPFSQQPSFFSYCHASAFLWVLLFSGVKWLKLNDHFSWHYSSFGTVWYFSEWIPGIVHKNLRCPLCLPFS